MSDTEESEAYLAFEAWCQTPLGKRTMEALNNARIVYRIWLAGWNAKTMADEQQWSLNERRGT